MAAREAGAREGPRKGGAVSAWLRKRIGRRSAQPQRQPWRVEGTETRDPGQPGEDRPAGQGGRSRFRFWWLLLVLLVLNWTISSILLSPPPRARVSYTFFLSQVQAKNVATITSTGEMIEGTLKKSVPYRAPTAREEEAGRPIYDAAAGIRK